MASRISKNSWRFHSADELRAWGKGFGARLAQGDVIALTGPLGAGKTTLVQGIVAGLGYARPANSPKFALANEYKTPKSNVYHMDMYRLSPAELDAFPLEDYFSGGICLIEWGDRVRSRWPEGTLELRLSAGTPATRLLQLKNADTRWKKRLRVAAASTERKRR